MPAYNEAVGIERAVRSLAASDYPDFEVIVVVDDGSTDGTADIVEGLALERVRLIRQDNAGKAAALNAGMRPSPARSSSWSTATPSSSRHSASSSRPWRTARWAPCRATRRSATGALLGRWQHIEYVMGFNLDRRMYEVLQCTPTVPGAIGAFRRDALDEVGGVSGDTLAEDTDLTLAIGRTGRRVVYAEDARAWTEAPSTLGDLWRQRYRWSYGTMQAVWKHKRACSRAIRGSAASAAARCRTCSCSRSRCRSLAPLIDLFALYGLIFTDPVRVIVLWVGFNLIQLGVAIFGFRLDRESMRPLCVQLARFALR